MLKPLNDVKNLKDPLKQFVSTWTFAFAPGSKAAGLFNSKDLELRCQSYGLPTLTGDTTEVTWGGFKRIYAGKQTRQGDWSVTFTEVWDASIMEGFKKWMNVYNDYVNGKISLISDYRADVNIMLVNPEVYDSDEDINAYSIKLYDVFPKEISLGGDINASGSEPIEIKGTFNFNYFLMGSEIPNDA